MQWPKICVALVLFASSLSSLDASAQTTARVELTLAGSDQDVRALRATLTEALSGSNTRLHTTRVIAIEPRTISRAQPSSGDAPHLWVDALLDKHATLYLTSADGSHVFVRQFELERGLDPVALELLGLVARSSLNAMQAGDSVGVSREEYERSLPPVAPPHAALVSDSASETSVARARARVRDWRFGALYELEALGNGAAQHGVGAQLEYHPSWFSLGLLAELRAPLQVGSGPVQVRLASRTAQFFATVPVALAQQTTLALGGAVGLDWIRVEGVEQAQNATAQPAYSVADSVLRGFVSIRYRLGLVELSLGTGVELGLLDVHYYLLRGEQRETVFTPWRLRPLGSVGLSACF